MSRAYAKISPHARRIRLGQAIRDLRGDMTSATVASRAGLDRTVISKVEAAERRAGLDTVMKILDALPIDPEGSEYRTLVQVARDGLGHGWWQDPDFRKMGERQARIADLECGAVEISDYHPAMIPGLLQTEEYARERSQVALDKGEQLDLHATVAGRIRRQEQVLAGACEYVVILEPQAVYRLPVSPRVMRNQLLHLHRIATTAENVRIHLMPVDARLPSGWVLRETFAVYRYTADDPRLVVVDTVRFDQLLAEPSVVAEYAQIHKELRGAALSREESADLIQQAADRLAAEV